MFGSKLSPSAAQMSPVFRRFVSRGYYTVYTCYGNPHRSAIASNERSVVAFRALIVALVFSGILVFCLSFQNKSPHRMAKVATPRLNE